MGNQQTTKSNQTQNQQYDSKSTYDFLNPPDTADISALRSHQFQIDPSIGARVGGAISRFGQSFTNPLGGASNPEIQRAQQRSFERDIMQTGGEQAREGAYDVGNQQYGQKLAVAGMTAPRLVQSGQSGTQSGTSTGTSTVSEPWYNGAMQGASSLGGALIM